MPIYEYRCEQGHIFEVMQRIADDPLNACATCSSPVRRVFHPVAVHFKGSGFYNTDYGKRKRGDDAADGGGEKADASSKESGSKESASKESPSKEASSPSESSKASKPGGGSGSGGAPSASD